MIQPTTNKTFHAQIITDYPMLLKPGTTLMIISNLAPAPYNLVQLTMRNTDVSPLALPKNKPIAGITVHLLDQAFKIWPEDGDSLLEPMNTKEFSWEWSKPSFPVRQ